MYVSVKNIKAVPPPTVPLFNPSEFQLGKEETRTASLTAQRNLPSKGRDEWGVLYFQSLIPRRSNQINESS